MGELFRKEIKALNSSLIKIVRGKGLMNAIVIDHKDSTYLDRYTPLNKNISRQVNQTSLIAQPVTNVEITGIGFNTSSQII